MHTYVIKRILLIFPTLLVASVIVAVIVRVLPGDPTTTATARGGALVQSEAGQAIARAKLGVDQPFHVQYIRFILGWPKTTGSVIRGQDAGETWRALAATAFEPFTSLTFLTNTFGLASGGRVIWTTKDGGRQWTPQHLADETIRGLDIADKDHVWAVGDNGTILHSSKGGRSLTKSGFEVLTTWQQQVSGTKERLNSITFVDPSTGWIVGDEGTILHTLDGGKAWKSQLSGSKQDLAAVEFIDGKQGLMVGENGTVLATNDGGLAWKSADGHTKKDLNAVAFTDELHVMVVGDSGTVIRSEDGGLTWTPQSIELRAMNGRPEEFDRDLWSVRFVDSKTGFVAGAKGTLLKTTDGGATWRKLSVPTDDSIADISVVTTRSGDIRIFAAHSRSYWEWGAIGGSFGKSIQGGDKVIKHLMRTFGPTVQLTIMTIILSTIVAVSLGVISALRQDRMADYLGRTFAMFGLAIPAFWLGTLVLIYPAVWFDWAPPLEYVGFFEDPLGNLAFYAMPVAVAGMFGSGEAMRMTRSMMLEVLRQDYIRTAWSKGLRERVIIYRHALKPAMIPVLTIIGMQIPYLLGTQVIIEQLFNVPGIGRLMLEAIEKRDYPLIQGVTLFLAVFIVGFNLLVDLAYGWLDPRIRFQ